MSKENIYRELRGLGFTPNEASKKRELKHLRREDSTYNYAAVFDKHLGEDQPDIELTIFYSTRQGNVGTQVRIKPSNLDMNYFATTDIPITPEEVPSFVKDYLTKRGINPAAD